jgi:mRNA deadenylase 3'-5' endonuclease subunit Ccr4
MKHAYAPISVRKWTRRRDKILDDLRAINADVFCLQEISSKGLKESFIPGLRHIGLDCCGFAPTRVGGDSKGKFAHKSVGCAIFARLEKLTVLASKRVHLKDLAPLQSCRSDRFYIDIKSLYNSMVMMHVQIKATNQTAIVANTHLYWNPIRADIKATQTAAAMEAISKFASEVSEL